jgi:hypothetical protein
MPANIIGPVSPSWRDLIYVVVFTPFRKPLLVFPESL